MSTVQANGLSFNVNRFRSGPKGKRPTTGGDLVGAHEDS